jgi:hypothetical protein
MARYDIAVTILTTITVDAPDAQSAIDEARRFAEACDPADGFADGWNDVSKAEGRPTIADVSGFDVEPIADDDCTELDVCRTDGCSNDPDDGEGFDGFCGSCADRASGED